MEQLSNYINGTLVAPESGRYTQLVNPATGQAYLAAPLSGQADVDAAVQAARKAFGTWRYTTPAERSLLLFRIADAFAAHADQLIEAECTNTGKPLGLTREVEFPGVLDHVRFFAAGARELRGLATGSYVTGYDSSMRREPLGVCSQISPWNYPLLMAVWKFGPALAAGNTVVLKPSDTTPASTVLAAQIMGGILPPGVFNVVVGDRDTGRALVSHPGPDLVSLTGSTRAGIEISRAAANDLKQLSLELGGKAPVVVFEDADIPEAAAGIAEAGLFNAGQDCEAACRVLVHEAIYDQFVAALTKAVSDTTYGAPDEDVAYGPLNSEAHLAKVQGFIDRLPNHATIECGGEADRRDGGFYFQPTVVTGLNQGDEMIQEEVFGPVLTVQKFSSEAEALELANGVRYGLAAGLWTKDHARVLRVTNDLDFGKVWVNCHLLFVGEMPNNGYKMSGHGNDLSVYAIEEYSRIKHVMSATGRQG
jgi:betaine-aldehyde dehydrogenase